MITLAEECLAAIGKVIKVTQGGVHGPYLSQTKHDNYKVSKEQCGESHTSGRYKKGSYNGN